MTGFSLPRPQQRKRGIAILPLINVVFLLLIFIVLSGVISAPDPFEVMPPRSSLGEPPDAATGDETVYVSARGELRFRGLGEEEAIAASVASLVSAGGVEALTIRADAGAPATLVVQLVERMRATGISRVELQVERAP